MSLRASFTAWLAGLTNDDGSGTTGDLLNVSFFENQMTVVDDAINSTGGQITTDTTYYVDGSVGGDDVDGDGSALAPWETLSHALDVLRPYRIAPDVTVTIQLEDGTYTLTSPIEDLAHEGALKIKGKNTYTKSMSSVQSSSGSAGNYSVILNLDDVTNVTTSDYAIILTASGGTNPTYLVEVHDITNVDSVNNRITINSKHSAGVPSGAVSASVIILKSTLFFVGCTGINNAKISLENVIIRGDGTASTNGIYTNSAIVTAISPVGILGFGQTGIYTSLSGDVRADSIALSGNGVVGAYIFEGSRASLSSAVISGNASGLACLYQALALCQSAIITGNGPYGVQCLRMAEVKILYAVLNAHTTDIYAGAYGYVMAVSASYSTVSPAVNTQGNVYGLIDTLT